MKTNGTRAPADAPGVVVHSIAISNVLGIRELKLAVPPGGVVFAGPNASGKTSALEALRLCLTGQGVSPKAIRRGASKGEVFLDLSHPSVGELLVTRSISVKSGGKLEVSGPDGVPLPAPQSILTRLLGAAPLCPLALWKAPAKEQREMILSAMPAPVTAGQVKAWCAEINVSTGWVETALGGIPIAGDSEVLPAHGLEVVAKIRGVVYAKRTKANTEQNEAEATAQQARQRLADAVETFGADEALPVDVAEQKLDEARVAVLGVQQANAAADLWKERVAETQIRIATLRGSVDLEAHPLPVAPSEKETAAANDYFDITSRMVMQAKADVTAVEEQLRFARLALAEAEQNEARARQTKSALEARELAADKAIEKRLAVLEQADALEAGIGAQPARVEVDHLAVLTAEKALARARGAVALNAVREDVAQAEQAASEARVRARDLDVVVKRLTNDAPGQLFDAKTALPGLTVTEDSFELNGVDIANLSGKEKLFFCTDAIRLLSKGKILLVELEALQPSLVPEFLTYATRDGFQVFATRIDDGPRAAYHVEAIGPQDVEPGQEWEHETQGRCVVVKQDGPSASGDDPWQMRRLSDGETVFMWRGAREEGLWTMRIPIGGAS